MVIPPTSDLLASDNTGQQSVLIQKQLCMQPPLQSDSFWKKRRAFDSFPLSYLNLNVPMSSGTDILAFGLETSFFSPRTDICKLTFAASCSALCLHKAHWSSQRTIISCLTHRHIYLIYDFGSLNFKCQVSHGAFYFVLLCCVHHLTVYYGEQTGCGKPFRLVGSWKWRYRAQ